MLFNAVITLAGLVLFGVLLRSACRTLFRSLTDTSKQVAEVNQLHFPDVTVTAASEPMDLDAACATLDRDYGTLCTLLEHTVGQSLIEEWMLRAYFRCTRIVFAVSRTLSRTVAIAAITEMRQIVTCLANEMGERMIARA